jgi:hypothetical protein
MTFETVKPRTIIVPETSPNILKLLELSKAGRYLAGWSENRNCLDFFPEETPESVSK